MLADRGVRCLLGGALGDALGYPIEFAASGAEIARVFGASAPSRLIRCDDGLVHVSDDTQMTLFTAEGLVLARRHGVAPLLAVHAAYQRWLYTQMPTRFDRPEVGSLLDVGEMYARRAPGSTCISARDLLAGEARHEETAAALDVAMSMRSPTYADLEALANGGWTGEWALAIAIACVHDARDAADAMWRAAAHAGDSDTTASIAGALLGAMGADMPPAWLADLEMRDVVERVARELVQAAAY